MVRTRPSKIAVTKKGISRLGYFVSVLNVTDQTDLLKLKLSLIPIAYPLREVNPRSFTRD